LSLEQWCCAHARWAVTGKLDDAVDVEVEWIVVVEGLVRVEVSDVGGEVHSTGVHHSEEFVGGGGDCDALTDGGSGGDSDDISDAADGSNFGPWALRDAEERWQGLGGIESGGKLCLVRMSLGIPASRLHAGAGKGFEVV